MNTPRTIAVCADDYGLSEGVNQAVLEGVQAGWLTAVSCMSTAPAWREGAAPLVAAAQGRADLGLHLNLSEHFSAEPEGYGLRGLILRAYAGRLSAAEMRLRVALQLDAFEQAVGRAPDFVDGHQHVHQLPGIRDLLVQALRERHPAPRPWLRCTRPEPVPALKPWLIAALGSAGLTRLARSAGLAQNHRLLGVYDFQGDAHRYERRLAAWLRAAREGDLLMCHPSLPTHAATDPILQARRVEADVLCSPLFADLLAREDIVLWPITRIQASQR